jgi:hypothetical protein
MRYTPEEIISQLVPCEDGFFYPLTPTSTPEKNENLMFCGSHALHLFLLHIEKPHDWAPTDQDAWCGEISNGQYNVVCLEFLKSGATVTCSSSRRIQCKVKDNTIDYIFGPGMKTMKQFDISVCQIGLTTQGFFFTDPIVVEDIMQGKMRVHPAMLGTPEDVVAIGQYKSDDSHVCMEDIRRLFKRVEKYRECGFEPYADMSADAER